MLYYIIGEEVLFEMMEGVDEFHDNWNNKADEKTNTKNIKGGANMDIKEMKSFKKYAMAKSEKLK